jgi:hypothetical protein
MKAPGKTAKTILIPSGGSRVRYHVVPAARESFAAWTRDAAVDVRHVLVCLNKIERSIDDHVPTIQRDAPFEPRRIFVDQVVAEHGPLDRKRRDGISQKSFSIQFTSHN